MIAIDNVLISDDIVSEKFVCDLSRCKGGCCEDGDAGAPLTNEELEIVRDAAGKVEKYLTKDGKAELERQGLYRYDQEFGWVTPTVNGGICAYGYRDGQGIIKCAFEQAYNDGLTNWKKPISCHLYPIKASTSKYSGYEKLNYEPRETMCAPACSLGKKLKVPVYQFLKEPLIRKFGEEFYEALHQVALDYFEATHRPKK
ncbi:MAG: DUF3109 family protein [Sphingobacteriales bacterium]|nr:MAG: DUF3109 family protein [Sphingobacteriales bacterium]